MDERDEKPIAHKSILYDFSSAQGSNILSELGLKFPNSKNVKLVKLLINKGYKNATILDFFAGSGTTGQAVMELNEDDGGNRRFILVTNNENNIARDICRERLFRVIKGHGSANEKIEWEYSNIKNSLENNSLRYLKIKQIDKVNGQYEDINSMKKLYWEEFHKDISIKDFSD